MGALVEWRTSDEIAAGVPLDPAAEGYQQIPTVLLRESPMNPRKHFDPAKLDELAASMDEHGVLSGPDPVDKDELTGLEQELAAARAEPTPTKKVAKKR